MAFVARGRTVVFPAAVAFSNSGAVQLDPGFQYQIVNGSTSVAWILLAATQAQANAAAVPTAGNPTSAFPVPPGATRVVQHLLGTSGVGAWANVCTPTDGDATDLVSITAGSGQ